MIDAEKPSYEQLEAQVKVLGGFISTIANCPKEIVMVDRSMLEDLRASFLENCRGCPCVLVRPKEREGQCWLFLAAIVADQMMQEGGV
jgi:hypothetical protein